MTRWIFPAEPNPVKARAIAAATGLHPALAGLLVARGADADLERFLGPRLATLTDPFLLPNMREAISRLLLAVQRGERIVLYGDYDVDGVTSLALVWRMLRAAGADAHCFLPDVEVQEPSDLLLRIELGALLLEPANADHVPQQIENVVT